MVRIKFTSQAKAFYRTKIFATFERLVSFFYYLLIVFNIHYISIKPVKYSIKLKEISFIHGQTVLREVFL